MASVDWSTANGTATAGSDYVAASGQVTFNPGEVSQPILVSINGDITIEPNETVLLQLSNAAGGGITDGAGTGTILNDETTIVIADGSATEGEKGYNALDVFVGANEGGLVHGRGVVFGPDGNLYVGHQGVDLQGPGVLRFNGQTGEFIDVFASVNSETSQLLFHNGYLFVAATSNILRFDALTGAPAPAAGKTGALFATLGDQGVVNGIHAFAIGPDGNLYVSNQNGDDILRYDGSTGAFIDAFVPAGSGGLDEPVGLTFGPDGHLYVGTNIGGTGGGGPDKVLRFQGPTESNPGAFIDTFVAAGSGGLDRVASGGIWFRPDGDLYVVSGDTSSLLRFNGSTGAFVETVIASGEGGLNIAGGFTVDNAGLIYINSQATHQVLRYAPAASTVLRVSLTQPSAVPVTVNYATANGTAQSGADFVASNGTVTFAPGETVTLILVPTIDDAVVEGNETFVVNLLNPSAGATIVDGQGSATIADNDLPPTKFYVVNDASQNQTYEYNASGTLSRVVQPEQRQHRPARSGQQRRGRQDLGRRRQPQGLRLQHQRRTARLLDRRHPGHQCHGGRHRHQRHRRLDRRCQERQGLHVHRRRQPPLRQPERRQQLQPEQRQHAARRTS